MAPTYDWPCIHPTCQGVTPRFRSFCDEHKAFEKIEAAIFERRKKSPYLVEGLTGVYVMGSEQMGAIKIGIAVDVMARLAQLQTGFPHPLSLYSAAYTSRRFAERIEQESHRVLSEFGLHLNGEWFDVDPNDASALVAKCADNLGLPILTCFEYCALVEVNEIEIVNPRNLLGVRAKIKQDFARTVLDAANEKRKLT